MRQTLRYSAILLLGLVVLVGCEKKEKEPETPPPPPPPTAEQVRAELHNAAAKLWNPPVSQADAQTIASNLQPVLTTHRSGVNGPEGIGRFRKEVADLIESAAAQERYGVVYAAIIAYETIEPGSTLYNRRKQRALDVLNRPAVTCNGFLETGGVLHVNLEVYDKQAKKTSSYNVREGDLFHNDTLQLIKVIGNQSEVQLKYLKTDDTWVVPGPKKRQR